MNGVERIRAAMAALRALVAMVARDALEWRLYPERVTVRLPDGSTPLARPVERGHER